MKTRLLIIFTIALTPLIMPNVSAMCAAEGMEWWTPCNDTGPYSDGIYVKYSILIPIIIAVILVSSIVFLIRRKRK